MCLEENKHRDATSTRPAPTKKKDETIITNENSSALTNKDSNDDGTWLNPTCYCDSYHPIVQKVAHEILDRCSRRGLSPLLRTTDYEYHSNYVSPQQVSSEQHRVMVRECAIMAFHFAQNSIRYCVGIYHHKASETIRLGYGSCSNKANVLVALLRAMNIPAGYGMCQVDAREYFLWPTAEFEQSSVFAAYKRQYFGEFSTRSRHFYAWLRFPTEEDLNPVTTWLCCDPSDDLPLSYGGQHAIRCLRPVRFDGRANATLHLNPAHVPQPSTYPGTTILASIDDYLRRQRKNQFIDSPAIQLKYIRIRCINWSMEYIRNYGQAVVTSSLLSPNQQVQLCLFYTLSKLLLWVLHHLLLLILFGVGIVLCLKEILVRLSRIL